MVCNTFGLTLAASTNQAVPNSRRLSTLCSAGIVMQLNATFTYRTFRYTTVMRKMSPHRGPGNWLSGKVNGSLGAGNPRSLSLPDRLNSSP